MNKQEFKDISVRWGQVVQPGVADHLEVCKEEYNELFDAVSAYNEAVKAGVTDQALKQRYQDCQKEFSDVLWTMAILEHLDSENSFLQLMQETLNEHAEFESAVMLDAVRKSNWSKMTVFDLHLVKAYEKEVERIAEQYKDRYTGVKWIESIGCVFYTDDKGKVLKPSNYRSIKSLLS